MKFNVLGLDNYYIFAPNAKISHPIFHAKYNFVC